MDDFAGTTEAGTDGGTGLDSTGINEDSTIIVTGFATIRTSTPQETAEKFSNDVLAAGGEISGTQQSEWDGSLSVNLDVRVPPGEFDAILTSLSDYGKVVDESTWRQDVGLEVADLSARRDALEQSIERLQQLMAQAETTDELLQAESILTERQAQLDSLNSQLKWLERQVEMSSLSVTFANAPTEDTGFSWERAWSILLDSFKVVGYALVVLLPWALIVTGVVFAIRAVIRKRRRPSTRTKAFEGYVQPATPLPEEVAKSQPDFEKLDQPDFEKPDQPDFEKPDQPDFEEPDQSDLEKPDSSK